MNGIPWTKEEDIIMKDNYPHMPSAFIAGMLERTIISVYQRAATLKIKKSAEFLSSPESGILTKGTQLGKGSWFKKGNVPFQKGLKWNDYMSAEAQNNCCKTQFKKGNSPHNTAEKDGVIRIRRGHKTHIKYKYIRVALGKWELLHHRIWLAAGKQLKKNHCVIFKDGNQLNCIIENLEQITFEQNMLRNTIHRYPIEIKRTIRTLNKLKKNISNGKK